MARASTPSTRKDPRSKTTDGSIPINHLSDADPKRKYTLVDPNMKMFGVAHFESMGYRQEIKTEGGVRFTRGGMRSENGQVLMCHDLVLMSCPIEEHEERRLAGIAKADAKDRAMTANRGKLDRAPRMFDLPATGEGGIHVVNETSELTQRMI